MLNSNTWNNLTVCQQMNSITFKTVTYKLFVHKWYTFMCKKDLAFIFVGVCKCQSEDSFVCFGTKPTQRACVQDFPRDQKRTREGRSHRTEVDRTGQSAGENRQLVGCVEPGARLGNVRGWVSIPGDLVGILLEYTLAIAHRMLGKCHKLFPSCAWS